jgi:rhodanese-related sulfurtransferase
MSMSTVTHDPAINRASTMQEILAAYPGAQRTLFKSFHIGGCSSCGFKPDETLEQVCQRNNNLNVEDVLRSIRESHLNDEKILISPSEVAERRQADPSLKILDVRSRQEFEAVHIEGAVLMSQPVMQEIMSHWPRSETFVIVDHQGRSGLDAAAYFIGHGFANVRCMRGGIDAWSEHVDKSVPRYLLA